VRVVWTPRASLGLRDARDYIADRDEAAATRLAARIVEAAGRLAAFPGLGRPGRVAGTHELVILPTPYIVVYRLSSEHVEILAVLHSARRWPRRL
jgi:toxin ParE1/3/4